MKIIGHRGAAGLAPENTLKAIKAGIVAGADAIEFDVRLTKDGIFVLHHDKLLVRTTGALIEVSDISFKELRSLPTFSKEPIPTLAEALEATGKSTAVIEAKGGGWSEKLAEVLSENLKDRTVVVISFDHEELEHFHELMPDVPVYLLENRHPVHATRMAATKGFAGVDLKYYLLNPVTYYYAKFLKVDVVIYTIDTPWVMRFLLWLYPDAGITTNRPDLLKKLVNT